MATITREQWKKEIVNPTQADHDNCLHVTIPGTTACPTCVARGVCKLTLWREEVD